MLAHLEELWGGYGPLGELWFDGMDPFNDEPELQARVAELAARLQPHAILLQGPQLHNGARKGNGETCTVHDPNWMTCPDTHGANGCRRNSKLPLGGQGAFIPAEGEGCCVGDGNSRQWFWHPDHDAHAALKTVEMFVDEYLLRIIYNYMRYLYVNLYVYIVYIISYVMYVNINVYIVYV